METGQFVASRVERAGVNLGLSGRLKISKQQERPEADEDASGLFVGAVGQIGGMMRENKGINRLMGRCVLFRSVRV
ncbi:hypothetical protein EBB07_11560 [Paenibacillaceae bacterium]|nr:hypothetical protein EBB07_11560 [Paenibacillaceae bacterium]